MKRSKRTMPRPARATKRAEALIESLLIEIQRGIDEPALLENPEWERIFGAKQSVVVNVQKLVQALAALPSEDTVHDSTRSAVTEGQSLSNEEIRMLTEWLAQGNGDA